MSQWKATPRLSLKPDPEMRWIYDNSHPEYHTKRAQHLRDARDAALRSVPGWVLNWVEADDALRQG